MLRNISFAIEHLSDDLRNSIDFMKPLIKQNGLHLQHAGPRVRSDEATAIEAFKQDANAFQYIGDSVKKRVVFLLFTNKISNIKKQQQITAASYVINNQESFSEEVRLKAAEALENTFWDDKSRFRSSNNEYKIEISSALVKKYPENVLKKLYSCFDKHPGAERLRLVQLHDATLERLPEVIDQAGVTRTFLTDLFQSLKEQAESDNYNLLRFENTAGGALPIASQKTKEGSYRSIPPHKVASLTEPKLREAVALAYLTEEDAPDELKNAEGELDLNKVKAKFDRIQRDIDSLSNEEERLYQIIGKLMGLCYSSNNRYLIGQIFDPLLFNVLHAIPTNELHKAYKRLNENTLLHMYDTLNPTEKRFSHLKIVHPQLLTEDLAQEVLLYAYPDEDERPDAPKGNPSLETVQRHFAHIQKDIRANLLEAAKQDATLRAIFAIGQGYAKHNEDEEHWRELVWSPPAIMLERIQGLFSPELVKNAIQCSNSTVKDYFIRWIDENSGDINKLQDFLYAVTGSRALAVGSKLNIEENLQSEQHLPQFHTCFRSVDVFRYRTYVIFKEKLETSIKESLASGFQRM